MRKFLTLAIGGVALGMAWLPQAAWACAACSGKSNDAMVSGLNAGVFTLLVILLLVMSAFALVFVRFLWLQSRHPELTMVLPNVSGTSRYSGGMSS